MSESLKQFPSPCGVWVVSVRALPPPRAIRGFRPLAGCGLFLTTIARSSLKSGFRPLAGCGLFLVMVECDDEMLEFPSPCGVWVVSLRYRLGGVTVSVSVPLRGVGCFEKNGRKQWRVVVSVPLRGVGCFWSGPIVAKTEW